MSIYVPPSSLNWLHVSLMGKDCLFSGKVTDLNSDESIPPEHKDRTQLWFHLYASVSQSLLPLRLSYCLHWMWTSSRSIIWFRTQLLTEHLSIEQTLSFLKLYQTKSSLVKTQIFKSSEYFAKSIWSKDWFLQTWRSSMTR